LSKRHNENSAQAEEGSKRHERAIRILDAATELVRRWGYGKTTIDDIARQAGVAKGTIYLHWKTREDLFKALMIREEQALAIDMKQRIESDPQGTTLHGMIKHMVLAILKNPIMKAAFLGDTNMLGEIARMKNKGERYAERLENFTVYFEALRSQGLLRTDLGLKEEVYMISAITTGFLLVEPLLPDEFKLSDEEAAELMAETIRRTFEPHKPTSLEATQAASYAFEQYLDLTFKYMKEESKQEIEQ
jgi:AcrR family transcriptional regulator